MNKNEKAALAVGAGLAAVAAAAAGVYMMTGKNAKNRKKVTKWAKDMQKDVVDQLNKAGKVTKTTYNKMVDTVAQNYQGLKNVNASELALTAADLKSSWDAISSEVKSASASMKSMMPKTGRGMVRKAVSAAKTPAKTTTKKAASKKVAAKKSRR